MEGRGLAEARGLLGQGVGSSPAQRAASPSRRWVSYLEDALAVPGELALSPMAGASLLLLLLPAAARRAPAPVQGRPRGAALDGDPVPRFAVQASAKAAGGGGAAGGSAPKPGRRGGEEGSAREAGTGRPPQKGKTQLEKDRRNWFGGAGGARGSRRRGAARETTEEAAGLLASLGLSSPEGPDRARLVRTHALPHAGKGPADAGSLTPDDALVGRRARGCPPDPPLPPPPPAHEGREGKGGRKARAGRRGSMRTSRLPRAPETRQASRPAARLGSPLLPAAAGEELLREGAAVAIKGRPPALPPS